MFTEHTTILAGQPIVDFKTAADWTGPGRAYAVRQDWDDENEATERLEVLSKQDGADKITGLVLGAGVEGHIADLNAKLVELRDAFPELTDLFLGDITYEENELSWIEQSDVGQVLAAFPKLRSLRVRGGTELSFSQVRHESLRSLAIETGGLSRQTVREIFQCELPNLEDLELLLGDASYGGDTEADDFTPVLSGQAFPNLKRLGLMNTELANDLAALVVNSPIVEQLEVLDLSMGTLDDTGAKSLAMLPATSSLKTITIDHHYITDEAIEQLRNAPALSKIELVITSSGLEDADEDWRSVMHAE